MFDLTLPVCIVCLCVYQGLFYNDVGYCWIVPLVSVFMCMFVSVCSVCVSVCLCLCLCVCLCLCLCVCVCVCVFCLYVCARTRFRVDLGMDCVYVVLNVCVFLCGYVWVSMLYSVC